MINENELQALTEIPIESLLNRLNELSNEIKQSEIELHDEILKTEKYQVILFLVNICFNSSFRT